MILEPRNVPRGADGGVHRTSDDARGGGRGPASAPFRRLPATSTRFAGSSACGWMNRTISGRMPVATPRANISGMRYEGQTIANLPRGGRYFSAAAYTSALVERN